ncbi:MAG TPA: adenylate/guanylate cyclase domain-containing protein [Nitrosopumilaceae archaeon]|nr:adenylate/guanylate cyclase domain-containing protein [Nitrosopumilaceae archaeon]
MTKFQLADFVKRIEEGNFTKYEFDIIIKEFENDICPVCGKAFKLHKPIELKYCLRKSRTRFGSLEDNRDSGKRFSEIYKNYAVGIVNLEDSIKITATLDKSKVCQYYSVFLNSMASIIKENAGTVVKNIGDSLLYYFPKTSDTSNISAFGDSLECGMKMIDSHATVNSKMREEGLPCVNYRVSSDHGMVTFVNSTNSFNEDMFGPTVNLCAKINSFAIPNSMAIGGDLYQIVKSFKEYRFEPISDYHNGLKIGYPVYSITRSKTKSVPLFLE